MRKLWKLTGVAAVTTVVASLALAGPAGANPPSGYGFDDSAHIIVGGGSDTTYKAMVGISDLYAASGLSGCAHDTGVSDHQNRCTPTGSPETSNLGNWQGDTITQANPIGSSGGIGALNGNGGSTGTYQGTVNPVPSSITCVNSTTGPNPDFARSSRTEKTSSGAAPCGNELTADTFWGFAQDGIELVGFNTHGNLLNGLGAGALSADQIFKIWNCSGGTGTGGRMRWSDIIPSIAPGSANDADIVPWQMNTSSGTFATFQSWVQGHASGVPNGWTPNGQSCDRKLATGNLPLENDIKPLINDPASLGTGASADNPENWMWWGSFGVFSAFPFTSAFTRGSLWSVKAAPVQGVLPSSAGIIADSYPIGRTLFHVTRKVDADCAKTGGNCDFPGNPGPALPTSGTDLNVQGGTSGISGAVREFTRWLCRGSTAQHGKDPFTGTSFFSEITTAINNAGFTVVPSGLRTTGSRCAVHS